MLLSQNDTCYYPTYPRKTVQQYNHNHISINFSKSSLIFYNKIRLFLITKVKINAVKYLLSFGQILSTTTNFF